MVVNEWTWEAAFFLAKQKLLALPSDKQPLVGGTLSSFFFFFFCSYMIKTDQTCGRKMRFEAHLKKWHRPREGWDVIYCKLFLTQSTHFSSSHETWKETCLSFLLTICCHRPRPSKLGLLFMKVGLGLFFFWV